MHDELAFRDYRPGWKAYAWLGTAGAACYALVAYGGETGLGIIAGLTVGYLFARITKF